MSTNEPKAEVSVPDEVWIVEYDDGDTTSLVDVFATEALALTYIAAQPEGERGHFKPARIVVRHEAEDG